MANGIFMFKKTLLLICLSITHLLATETTLIPQPKSIEYKQGKFSFPKNTQIINKAKLSPKKFKAYTASLATVTETNFSTKNGSATISLELGKIDGGREAYTVKVSNDSITILANTDAGLLYGLQTLSQLVKDNTVPVVQISDSPRFEWRGLHLDVSRHFFDKAFIKRYLDLMSLYKYNVFHWHLTDDDGWRIESKKFPKLTEVGAFRNSVGRSGNQAKGLNVDDGKPYGGFYTQEDIKEIIAYAKELNIEILPEIDVPGHSRAIVRAYPELGARPNSDVLNVGSPKTLAFLKELFSEVSDLFPFSYVHIGCDEVGLGQWLQNKDCLAKMKKLNTKDPHVLHRWFAEELQKHLATENKEAIAWCEVLDTKISKETVVMAWRDNGGWILAPKRGHKVVVTPSMQTYFNYQEDTGSNAPGHGGYRTIMEKVYKFDPVEKALTNEQKKLVIGGQGCVWTEFIPKPEHVEYIAFPRAAALSEALWSPLSKKDWNSFPARLEKHLAYMDQFKIQYRVGAPLPVDKQISFINTAIVKFTNPNLQGTIHYTTDDSEPTASSAKYNEKTGIKVSETSSIKAIVVYPNGRTSYRTKALAEKVTARKGLSIQSPQAGLKTIYFTAKAKNFSEAFDNSLTVSKLSKDKVLIENSGFIKIDSDANYNFKVNNGAQYRVYINGAQVSDNKAQNDAFLGNGYHAITVLYYGNHANAKLNLLVSKDMATYQNAELNKLVHTKQNNATSITMIHTNMKKNNRHKVEHLLDSDPKTYYWARQGVTPQHFLEFKFNKAKKASGIEVITGKFNGGDELSGGNLLVSYDGKNYVKISDFTGGIAKGRPEKAILAVKIQVIRPQGNWLVIREINIK